MDNKILAISISLIIGITVLLGVIGIKGTITGGAIEIDKGN